MILTCPECSTRYFVPDESLGPSGRRVRCQACAHTWMASADAPMELTLTPEEGASASVPPPMEQASAPELPRAFRARAEQERRTRRLAAQGAIWGGIGAAFVGLIAAAFIYRVELVELYPRAASAYALAGVPVNPVGLEFQALRARDHRTLPGRVVISGAVRNIRGHEAVIPPIRVSLLDARGRRIGSAVVPMERQHLAGGALKGFAVVLDDPASQGADVDVRFDFHATRVSEAQPTLRHARHDPAPLPEAEPVPAAEAGPDEAAAPEPPAATSPALRPTRGLADTAPVDARVIEALDSPPG
ncbi:MAG: MJ0042-type zinc finger domain-containing protein [Brevundimonas sp.]|uniref:MJ0042-type zinc finger domain-containing protein n=1 Tax=Brevundimonas sp. TaxID=1871086 RepID=UPI00391D4FA5